jgi:hypothetical protein
MPRSKELISLIKTSHPEVVRYIAALEKENAKAQTRIADLEAKSVSSDHKIEALKVQVADFAKKERSPLAGMSVREKIAALTAARRRESSSNEKA